MRIRQVSAGLVLGVLLLPVTGQAQQKARFSNLQEALSASGALAGGSGPQNVNWIEGGNRFSYVQRNATTRQAEIRALNPATGKDTLLFDGAGLTFPGTNDPFRYRSFQWSQDSRYLVFQTNFKPLYRRSGTADFYVYSLAEHSLRRAAQGARTGELSPDGTMLGYERDGNMFVSTLATGQEKQLTSDATETVFNGHFDWVYEEEFGMAQAWTWSPDSRFIAYWQTDASPEPFVQITNYDGRHPDWDRIRIPQPGDHNGKVRIGVVDVKSGQQIWLDPGVTGDFYIPRIYWTSDPHTLAVMVLNRAQNELRVFFFDVTTGERRLVLTQTSPTWIDVYDFFAGVDNLISFPPGLREFFWISDQDGHQHIYRYDYTGKLLNQVTKGDWTVTRIEGIDPKTRTIYYTSTQPSPLQRQLWAIRFDGTHQRRLSRPEGRHSIDMAPNTRFYIDRYSSTEQPRQVGLWATGGKLLKSLEDNASVNQWLEGHAYSPQRLFHFTTTDSVTLDGSMTLPVPFDSTRRYPVVVSIYGGPGAQQVYDQFSTSGWTQWLAQQGYIVVGLNNRGSGNYGRDFMKQVYQQLGRWESNDFAEVAHYLAKQPYVDGAHMAIMGTSYGGYSTIYTMVTHPDAFAVGIANSPVTDWRLYDSIYTERYMGLLTDDAKGYEASAAETHASQLQGRLLIVHSMMDDNVHPANTMQMLTAFTNAGKDVDLRIFPPGAHGAAYNGASYMLMEQIYFRYLERFLKGNNPYADVNH